MKRLNFLAALLVVVAANAVMFGGILYNLFEEWFLLAMTIRGVWELRFFPSVRGNIQ